MAGAAIVGEQVAGHGQGLRVVTQSAQVQRREARKALGVGTLGYSCLLLMLPLLAPVQNAGKASEARIKNQVNHCEYDRGIKQPQPPARQRMVVFSQIAVPNVAG